MMSYKVSYFMSVKNGYPLIEEALRSFFSQSYKNVELVIVDDGSVDETVSFLKAIEDPRCRVIYTDGVGRAKALNIAVAEASGDYLCNLDCDDVLHPEKTLHQVNAVSHTNGAIDFICARYKVFSDHCVFSGSDRLEGDFSLVEITKKLMKNNPIAHSSVMIKRDVLLGLGGYCELRDKQVDYELWGRLAASGVELYMHPLILVGKRVHDRQSFERKNRLPYLISSFKVQLSIIKALKGGVSYYAFACMKFFYGLMPSTFRSWISKYK